MLLGNQNPAPMVMADLEGARTIRDARRYMTACSQEWRRKKTGVAVLRWASTHPRVLDELAWIREADFLAATAAGNAERQEATNQFWERIGMINDSRSRMLGGPRDRAVDVPWASIEAAMKDRDVWAR